MRSLLAGTNVAPASAKAAPVARHPQADPTPPWARIIITRLDEAKDEEISECETLRAQLEQAHPWADRRPVVWSGEIGT